MNFGNLVSGAMGLFGHYDNPADKANKRIGQIPGQVAPHYDPYSQNGQTQMGQTSNQYTQLQNDPGKRLNEIGEGFHESPGFKFALQQALQASGNAAAAGGMAGSPEHEQQNMEIATQAGNQDYYNYLDKANDLYKTGLNGGQTQANNGQTADQQHADMIAQTLAQQGAYDYEGTAANNKRKQQAYSDIGNGLFYNSNDWQYPG